MHMQGRAKEVQRISGAVDSVGFLEEEGAWLGL